MNLFKKIIIAGLFFFAGSSFAAVGSGDFNILKVEVTEKFFTVYVTSGSIPTDDCEDGYKIVFWRDDYPNGYNSMLSVALSAYVTNRKVSMWLSGCKLGPWGKTLPKAQSIVITG